ncbi:MAG: hypothetical protein ACI80N_004311 [Gammaproteobacteria bacterium]
MPGPVAPLVGLRDALDNPPDFLRLHLDAQQAAILKASTRASMSLLGAGSFTLVPDPNTSGSILEGYCTSPPAQGPPAGLVASKDGAVRRLASWCETSAGGGISTCQLYLDLGHLNGAAFGGSNLGPLWICSPACASGSECSPLMDLQGVIRCECRVNP